MNNKSYPHREREYYDYDIHTRTQHMKLCRCSFFFIYYESVDAGS
jgi:Zn-finger protein